jgi:hypothetical protein
MFFSLEPYKLKLVFELYELKYGKGSRKYAEETFSAWRSGSVQMSGEVCGRLIRIVPIVATFDQKYDLIEKLWNRSRTKTTLNVTISPREGLESAIDAVMRAVEAVAEHEIPSSVIGTS